MSRLHVTLCGAPGMVRDGAALNVDTRQALPLCQAQGDRHREATIYRDIGKQGAGWEPAIWKLVEW